MAEPQDGIVDSVGQPAGSYYDNFTEPLYEAFICPLTKKVMVDPVTIESGQTFEREAIERWFRDCRASGKRPTCPVSLKELNSTALSPSIALKKAIAEWSQRNEVARLDHARKNLTIGSDEADILQALDYVRYVCQKIRPNRNVDRKDLIGLIINMLIKSGSMTVRCKALETLRIIAEEDDENKEDVAVGDTIRTIVKFLSHGRAEEKELAVSLLYELSKSDSLCERIGGVGGAILILVGMSSSESENRQTVEKAEKTLENLEKYESNIRQMAESGRMQPLLRRLLEGSLETQLSMASFIGELVLSNDMKVLVANSAGSALVELLKSKNKEAREAALKALNQISSYDSSAKILISCGILPPLVMDLFNVSTNQLPLRLKEVAATILANIVTSGADFTSIVLDRSNHTLVSEDIIHNLLHLISNTGPAIECKLLQVLVGLTNSSTTVLSIVASIKSSGATVSLIQFVEAPQRDVRVAAIKLLHNISTYMSQEIADAFRGNYSQLTTLVKVIGEIDGISEEQAAAAGIIADLPEMDSALTKKLLDDGAFNIIINKLTRIRLGEIRGGRFVNSFREGLIRVLARFTYALTDVPETITLAQEHNLTVLFTEELQMNGLDKVQIVSALALANLSRQSKNRTQIRVAPKPGPFASIFPCFARPPVTNGLCEVHRGVCSARESFCLLESRAVENLVALLDHTNEKVVEAALTALCTLLDDGVDIEKGVMVLLHAEGIRPILTILCDNRTEVLRQLSVSAVERILRTDDIAYEISGDQNVGTALVEAFRHGDYRTRQNAERALKRIDKLPNFSGIYSKIAG